MRGSLVINDEFFAPIFWTIHVPDGNENIHIEHTIQYGQFSSGIPMRIQEHVFEQQGYFGISRCLLSIQTDKEIRIVQFDSASDGLVIDFRIPDKFTTFYQAPPRSTITYATMISEMVRRPLNLDQNADCGSIEFPPGQNIFLAIGIKNTYLWEEYSFVLHHIHEFYNYSLDTNITNVANRKDAFPCKPSQYWETGFCYENVQKNHTVDDEITFITSRFIDFNRTTFGTKSYHDNDNLNAALFCNLPYMGPSDDAPDPDACASAAQSVNCDAEIFATAMGDANNLLTFFMNYWQHNIFITKNNTEIEVLAMTLDISYDTPQASTNLIAINRFKTSGKIMDLSLSTNGHNMFITMSRKAWEIESAKRYKLVCETLKNDPHNPFLKSFKDECLYAPPKDVDENQFMMISSLCWKVRTFYNHNATIRLFYRNSLFFHVPQPCQTHCQPW